MLVMEHNPEMVMSHGLPNFYQPSIQTWQHQPRRNLPTVPTLPSTPGISRPGSSAGQIPMKQMLEKLPDNICWEPATPPMSAASPWGSSITSAPERSEPSTPGAIGMPVLLSPPSEQNCGPVDYFSTQPSYDPVQTNTPSTPVFGEPGCINPALISIEDFAQPTPPVFAGVPATSVPVAVENISAPVASPISSCVSTPITANPAELTLSGASFPTDFETQSFELSGLGIKRPNSCSNESSSCSDELPRKKVKKEVQPKDTCSSPAMSPSVPTSPVTRSESPVNESAQGQSTTPAQSSDIQQILAEGTVIQGPPPQNRRGRKQSFTKDPSKPFGCLICDRWFRRQEHLKRHHKSLHTNDRPHTCNECGKKFSRSDNLTQHQRTHGSGSVALEIMPQSMQQIQPSEHMQVQSQMVNTHPQGGVPPYEHLAQVMFTVFSEIGGSDNEIESETQTPTDNQGVSQL